MILSKIGQIFARIPPAWKTALVVGLAARIVLGLWGIAVFSIGIPAELMESRQIYYWGVEPVTQGVSGALWGVWQRWDAIHYIRIAQSGYTHEDLSVFYPLYPLLGKCLALLTGLDILVTLSLVSLVCTIVAMAFLYKIIAEYLNPAWAKPSVIFMAVFPSAFFFFAPYPQSLGLMLILMSIWYALKQRWLGVACCGLAVGLTHSTTFPLVFSLTILALRSDEISWKKIILNSLRNDLGELLSQTQKRLLSAKIWGKIFIAFTPLIGSAIFLLWRSTLGFPPYEQVQLVRWGRTIQWPWEILQNYSLLINLNYLLSSGWINLLSFICSLSVGVYSVFYFPTWIWVFQASSFLMLTFTNMNGFPLASYNRLVLLQFPIFMILASMTISQKRARFIFLVIFGLLQLYITILNIMWVWVG